MKGYRGNGRGGRNAKGKKEQREGRERNGRDGKERGGRARLGYFLGAHEFLVTPLLVRSKFVTKSCKRFPPYLNNVCILSCET